MTKRRPGAELRDLEIEFSQRLYHGTNPKSHRSNVKQSMTERMLEDRVVRCVGGGMGSVCDEGWELD